MTRYVLHGRTPVACPDVRRWSMWWQEAQADEAAGRRVARTDVREGVWVSTVFLGIDHNYSGTGPPILFETMVNRRGEWDEQARYATWDEAEAGHAAVAARVRAEGVDR